MRREQIERPRTPTECRELKAWAEAQPILPRHGATQAQIEDAVEFMASTLPSKAIDQEAGRRRFAVYVSILSGQTKGALDFLTDRAVRTQRWLPTPKECLDIIADYSHPETPRALALRYCAEFGDDHFTRWLAHVRDGNPIGSVPDQWQRIAVEQGVLRRLDDGSYVSRARFIGPTMAGKL